MIERCSSSQKMMAFLAQTFTQGRTQAITCSFPFAVYTIPIHMMYPLWPLGIKDDLLCEVVVDLL